MKSNSSPTRLVLATGIFKAVAPVLNNRQLFVRRTDGAYPVWISKSFHIAVALDLYSTSMPVWPFPKKNGLSKYPVGENEMMNLRRLADGSFDLLSFRGGDWEEKLLRQVGAPLGLRP